MKSWILRIVLLKILFFVSVVHAQVIHVPAQAGNDTLRKAVEYANETTGVDVVELTTSGGLYITQESSVIKIRKPILIRAAEGLAAKPIIQNMKVDASTRILFEIMDGGSLTLRGLELDGLAGTTTNAKYIIRTDDDPQAGATGISVTNPYTLKVFDCYFHDVVKGSDGNFFRAYKYTFADSVIFRNCIFKNCGKEGIRLKGYYDMEGTGFYQVHYFEVTNCTFYNTNKEAIVLYAGDNEPLTIGPKIRIDHCTFDNCGYNNSRIVNAWECDDTEVKNCIMTNSPTNEFGIKLYGPTAIIHHCNLYNVGDFKISRNAVIGESMLYVDPLYQDAANGDFTLDATSSVLGQADDGMAMGDPRWDPSNTSVKEVRFLKPAAFVLEQNYPNPFNSMTNINYALPEKAHVMLTVFDMRGRVIRVIVDEFKEAGFYSVQWNGAREASGVYIYRIQAGNFVQIRKCLLIN